MSVCWKIIVVILLLPHLDWIFVCAFYPMIWLAAEGRKHDKAFLRLPYRAVERFLHGGGERFVIFKIAKVPSVHLRKWLYKGMGADIGERVVVHFGTEIRCPERLTLGAGTIIGDNAILDARRGLTLGRNVNLSSNVSIYTLQHDHRDPYFDCPPEDKVKFSVEIDDRAWIGSNVTVLPGVHVGEGAVCCAGCVVTKDVEPYAVVAGIPARKVGERPRCLKYDFDGKSCRLY